MVSLDIARGNLAAEVSNRTVEPGPWDVVRVFTDSTVFRTRPLRLVARDL